MAEVIPTRVLSDALREAVRGRRVRAAVFTTFAFDPGFFEQEVLPLLFGRSFSHDAGIRPVQLEEALRGAGNQPERFVHAKVYRLWSRQEGREYLLISSANLTHAAHGKSDAGNLEAAVLLDPGPHRAPQFWLDVVGEPPRQFRVEEDEEGAGDSVPPPVALRYLWD